MMLHIKFDQDWPTGFRDIQVQKYEIFAIQGRASMETLFAHYKYMGNFLEAQGQLTP